MHVVFVYADSWQEWNCSEWRMKAPSDTFNRTEGWTGKLIHYTGFMNYLDASVQDIVGPADLIIFQRNIIQPQALDAIAYWRGLGKPVVVDLDDAYQILPYSNPAHRFWIQDDQNIKPLEILERGLREADGLVAPNRMLLHSWNYVTKGYYLPNFARGEWWSDLPPKQFLRSKLGIAEEAIVVGWGGSVSHYDSWWGSGIREAAARICKRHSDVVWLICGNDRRIYEQLPVPSDQKAHLAGVPPEQWPHNIVLFDIGVAPLYGIYDQFRSWIKGMEYLLAGVPWIGTRGEPYGDLAGLGILTENGPESWEYNLERLVTHIGQAQESALERVPIAQKQFFLENRLDVFDAIYQRVITDSQNNRSRLLPGVYKTGELASEQEEKE